MTPPRTVACPHCGTPVAWTSAARWRPFCSERCKTIDLGAWASEAYRVPVPGVADIESEAEAHRTVDSEPERR